MVKKVCKRCNKTFEVIQSRANSAVFCSRDCKNKRVSKFCACGKSFDVVEARQNTAKYCSRKCLHFYRNKDGTVSDKISKTLTGRKRSQEVTQKMVNTKRQRGTKPWNWNTATLRVCQHCKKEFKAIGKRKHTAKYCSQKCRTLFTKQHVDLEKHNYYRAVRKVTESQELATLPFFEKRGKASRDKDAYHLDHIFPIIEGYRQGIDPKVIGHISNLRFVPYKQNLKKGQKQTSVNLEQQSKKT